MYPFIYPILVLIIIQLLKLTIESIKGKFSWNHLFSNGGMPSSHSAFMAAVTTIIYLIEGKDSVLFMLSLAITFIVIWDAVKTRWQIGFQGMIMNKLIKELPDNEEYKYPLINERIGHKPAEVAVGLILGSIIATLLFRFI